MDGSLRRQITRVCVHLTTLRYDLTRLFDARDETSLRAPNNFVFPADDLLLTITKWYQFYNASELRDMYIVLPKNTSRKARSGQKTITFSMELYINVDKVRPLISPSASLNIHIHTL